MWRLAIVLSLLWPSAAFAGQARAQFQVGMIITGKGSASTVKSKTVAGTKNGAVASRAQTTKARIRSAIAARQTVPATP